MKKTKWQSDIEENQNVEDDEAFSELRRENLQEVALSHPICYDSYNICDFIADFSLKYHPESNIRATRIKETTTN